MLTQNKKLGLNKWNSQIKFKTTELKSSISDYRDKYNFVKETVPVKQIHQQRIQTISK